MNRDCVGYRSEGKTSIAENPVDYFSHSSIVKACPFECIVRMDREAD